jgi:hypothetical protein
MNPSLSLPPCDLDWWHEHNLALLRKLVCGGAFPTRDQLWRGAVLGTLAHALSEFALSNTQVWDGSNYLLDNESGDCGVVTFAQNRVVAMFFFHEDHRSAWQNLSVPHDLRTYFAGMPDDLLALAEDHTFRWMSRYIGPDTMSVILPRDWVGEAVDIRAGDHRAAIITAAFWGTGDDITAAEPWPEVFTHGAHMLDYQLMNPDDALRAWRDNYGLSRRALRRIRDLYMRWLSAPDGSLVLSFGEARQILPKDEEDARYVRGQLASIGITIEG